MVSRVISKLTQNVMKIKWKTKVKKKREINRIEGKCFAWTCCHFGKNGHRIFDCYELKNEKSLEKIVHWKSQKSGLTKKAVEHSKFGRNAVLQHQLTFNSHFFR